MSGESGNSHTNLEIGRTLARARAERGLSLWQVEEATKIRARYLHDLERENFDVLPAVYVLGSLKTYADFLGLDGEALVRGLKNRQAPPLEERDPIPEEPPRAERGGFLAALGGLPVVGGRDAVEDGEGAAPATTPGYGFRLHLGMGAILILALAIALGSIFVDGGEPAVSQVREPTISEAPSRIAFSGDAQDARDDERYQDADGTEDQPGKQGESPDDGGEEDKKVDERNRDDKDATQPEDTGDVAITLPASIAVSASTASASASVTATSASASSASASASSAASASAAGTPVASATVSPSSVDAAPAATAPETAEPNAAPRPAVGQPTPGAAGAPAGPRRIVVVADGARPVEGIIGKVRIVRLR